ncbi:MAG TPA: hypothetical protein VN228_22280 [Pyrinomonadaceae bacterium]|nr:hypothetical protein [Pyrinomonadaceae bacterium]
MSAGLCANCKRLGFVWSLDADRVTQWYCSLCGFVAVEDESKEAACAACGRRSAVWLVRDGRQYYWCVLCGFSPEQAA